MRDEIAMAASINATYSRPERFKPSCGTSDPGIMQVSTEQILVEKKIL